MDMGMLKALIEMLRGKPGNEAVQADQAPQAVSGGLQAATNPAYAAYRREAESMGEPVMSPEEYAKAGAR